MLIVVAVLAVTAALALPSYSRHLQTARRADARVALLEAGNQLEKYYSDHLGYTSSLPTLGVDDTSPNAYYDLAVELIDGGYRVTATPAPESPQWSDTNCRVLSIESNGDRLAESALGEDTSDDCW